jgi:hypothetical protein
MRKTMGFCFIALLLICGNQLWAQDQAAFAPVGQKLVEELLVRHQPNLLYVGLHVTPPGGTTQVFVAATGEAGRSKIGQKSSCTDLWELANGDGAPALELKGGGGSMVKGVLLGITAIAPLRDKSGATIGLINMGLSFTLGEESEAVEFATSVGQELSAEIPSKSALFEGAQKVSKESRGGARRGDSFEVGAVRACPMSSTRSSGL